MGVRGAAKLLLVALLCAGCQCKTDLSKYFRSCNRDAADLNECLAAAVQEGILNMADGIPEVDLPSLDPHLQKDIRIEYKSNQIVAKMHLKNIRSSGLKSAKVHAVRAKIDEDRFLMEVDLTQKVVDIDGAYRADGRYNALQVNTRGHFNATMRKLKITWKLEGTPEERDGAIYCRITKFWMRPDIGDLKFYASNIFPDNAELTELANNVSNQNWRILYRELLPYAQDNWNKIGTEIANKLFLAVPYDQIFPVSS